MNAHLVKRSHPDKGMRVGLEACQPARRSEAFHEQLMGLSSPLLFLRARSWQQLK